MVRLLPKRVPIFRSGVHPHAKRPPTHRRGDAKGRSNPTGDTQIQTRKKARFSPSGANHGHPYHPPHGRFQAVRADFHHPPRALVGVRSPRPGRGSAGGDPAGCPMGLDRGPQSESRGARHLGVADTVARHDPHRRGCRALVGAMARASCAAPPAGRSPRLTGWLRNPGAASAGPCGSGGRRGRAAARRRTRRTPWRRFPGRPSGTRRPRA